MFEGEYLNGKRWNGKGYADSNKVVYELENGKGKVKEYKLSVLLEINDFIQEIHQLDYYYLKFEVEYKNEKEMV